MLAMDRIEATQTKVAAENTYIHDTNTTDTKATEYRWL